MKPAPFRYVRVSSVPEAVSALRADEEAKVLAGGQSLLPAMNFRLARPTVLVDINHIPDLEHIEVHDGQLRVGALVRHARLEQAIVDDPLGKLLTTAARDVGHYPIRVRGTFGGSMSHADPAAEWCLIARTLDADIVIAGEHGSRVAPAASFFQTVFTTDLNQGEVLTEVRLPLLGGNSGVGFAEFSRRAGDFALIAVAAVTEIRDGVIRSSRIGVCGLGSRPERAVTAESLLEGRDAVARAFDDAAEAAREELNPFEDIHATAEYRRHLIGVLTKRALNQTLRNGAAP